MWLLKDKVNVDKDWFESLSYEDQLKWVETQSIRPHEVEEVKKKCNGKRKGNTGEVKQDQPKQHKGGRRKDRKKKQGGKGSED